jgi:transcriptional antiterminator NusG
MEEDKQQSEENSSEEQKPEAESPKVNKEEAQPPAETPAEMAQEPSTPAVEPVEEKPEEAPEEPEIKEEEPVEEVKPVEEKAEADVEEIKEEAEEKEEEEEEEKEAKEEAKEVKPRVLGERKWYVIQALTGQEDRVKQAIELTIESKSLKEKVFQVLVPTEETVEIKGGKRVEKVKKMFPGYVFLEMILDEESWYLIRQTPGVARFIGTKIKPTPVSDKEMQRVLKQLGKEERLEISFEKGEVVRVISGPFRGYTGSVDEVNAEKGKLKVLINIFGRDTPVEVNFEHAQKIV